MEKIYIIFGTTGEYSDREEWAVKAFRDEEKAKELLINASNRAKALFAEYKNGYDIPDGANEYDREMRADYTGTEYYIEECELS